MCRVMTVRSDKKKKKSASRRGCHTSHDMVVQIKDYDAASTSLQHLCGESHPFRQLLLKGDRDLYTILHFCSYHGSLGFFFSLVILWEKS